ncbi:Alanine aminotransferase 1 [Toxocara canis]|uniref:alanine transaminase n=1 Tax=Toxocara canis TaxID=6265 RepID=A0A0B2V9Y4_TOXCA|nr:Alanine aminotransferase 1 [Toxocara canis]
MASTNKLLNMDNLNPHVKTMEYAVRGPLVIRAVAIEKELEKGASKPFKSVIKANIGDAHAMGQKPISFIREVLACVSNPTLLDSGNYKKDVVEHARVILNGCGGHSAGAYSQSNGIEIIRQHVAEYITRRDGGIPSDPENIVLSGGASEGIRNVLKLFINHDSPRKTGVMIPIPQYPLYSASVEEFGLGQVGYYLEEEKNWALEISELERALKESKDKYDTRVLCVINPGNPTGQVLSKENIEEIIRFAVKHKLFLMADEVYQDNIYAEGSKFHSFKKVMMGMGEPYSKHELASFHSVSKGYMGECGMRGGYAELVNWDPDVFTMFKKMISAKLCSTILGQVVYGNVDKVVMFCISSVTHELASFHSVSKGYMGECGMRGGYAELVNWDPDVFTMFKKMISAKLCSTILGQTVLDCVVNPPRPGDPSYDLWLKEKTATLDSLKERARLVKEAYGSIEGIKCNPVQGAMYAFPQIMLPPKAVQKAKSLNQAADFFYAMQLLEATGVCVVPGSGFGQKDGTYHFRTTILPQPPLMKEMLERFKGFHTKFMKEYS